MTRKLQFGLRLYLPQRLLY